VLTGTADEEAKENSSECLPRHGLTPDYDMWICRYRSGLGSMLEPSRGKSTGWLR
jgi:hypothetical protein